MTASDPLLRPWRSVLYIPASNARAMEKARSLPVDAIIFDLEDAVAPSEKTAARVALAAPAKSARLPSPACWHHRHHIAPQSCG